jgi:DNA-binding FrmR family transcriptional regulator
MQEKDEMISRLRKVEGQIRGIQRMIAEERACNEVIAQVLAASSALDKVGLMVVSQGIKNCLQKSADGEATSQKMVDDAVGLLLRMAKRGI